MKNILRYILLLMIAFYGCSNKNNDSNPVTSGIIGTPTGDNNNGGNVTFTIGQFTANEGNDFNQDGQADESFYLTAKPSVNVKITKVDVQIPNNENFDSIEVDGTTVYNANEEVQINSDPYFNVNSGQQFTIIFTGTIADNNQNFNVTSEYTVP